MFFSVSNGEELTFESFSSEENALNFRTRDSKWLFTQRRLKLGPDSCDTIARSCVWVPCNGVDLCRLQHKLVHTIVTNLVVSLSRFKCLRLSKSNTSDLFTILTCILENRHNMCALNKSRGLLHVKNVETYNPPNKARKSIKLQQLE